MSNPILQRLDKIPHHLKFISQKHYDHAEHCQSKGKMQVLHRNRHMTVDQGLYGVVGSWELRSLYRLYYIYMNEEGDYFCVRYDRREERHIACRSSRRSFCKHIFFFLYETWWRFTNHPDRYRTRMDYWIRRAIHKVPMFHYRQGRLTFEVTLNDLQYEFETCENYRSEWDENNDSLSKRPRNHISRCREDKFFALREASSDYSEPPILMRIPVNKVQRGKKKSKFKEVHDGLVRCFSCGMHRIENPTSCEECGVSYCETCEGMLHDGNDSQCLNASNRFRAHRIM